MNDMLKAVLILVVYILVQSFLLALFASLVWQLILAKSFNLYLGYFHWVGIMFIINLLRFDTVEKINNFNKMMMDGHILGNLQKRNNKNEVH